MFRNVCTIRRASVIDSSSSWTYRGAPIILPEPADPSFLASSPQALYPCSTTMNGSPEVKLSSAHQGREKSLLKCSSFSARHLIELPRYRRLVLPPSAQHIISSQNPLLLLEGPRATE